jgi:hypothetical protein
MNSVSHPCLLGRCDDGGTGAARRERRAAPGFLSLVRSGDLGMRAENEKIVEL